MQVPLCEFEPLMASADAISREARAMLLSPQERRKKNLQHAHWRVDFLLRLLDSHRALPAMRDATWQRQEDEYLRGLAQAQVELDRAEWLALAS
jgi:hypothetical protein